MRPPIGVAEPPMGVAEPPESHSAIGTPVNSNYDNQRSAAATTSRKAHVLLCTRRALVRVRVELQVYKEDVGIEVANTVTPTCTE